MGQFAQLTKTASGGIPLERVDGPANVTELLAVAGIRLQGEPRPVHPLQKLFGAFEEDVQELRGLLVGMKVHRTTLSIRWYTVALFSWIIWNFVVSPNRLSAWPTNK